MAREKERLQTYNVRCGDNSSGAVSAQSPDKAKEMADEMCQVHDGVQGRPSPRTKRD